MTQPKGLTLVLSGGGVRATVFHMGVLLRLAAEERLEEVRVLSTVSGGSLAAALVFTLSGLKWPTSQVFIDDVLPAVEERMTFRSLQGGAVAQTAMRPWKLFGSRGDLFANALERIWGIKGNLKDLASTPRWFINTTCYETGRNWRFSQEHIGDWKFGHNFEQVVQISTAVAASGAIPYMAGFVKLAINHKGWFSIDAATDEPKDPIEPMRSSVRLWDGGVYENLGMEPVYKPTRGLVFKDAGLLVVSDASARLKNDLGPATGIFTDEWPFVRGPRLFDIATEQTRALRSRILLEAIIDGRLQGVIVRVGNDVPYIYSGARKAGPQSGFLSPNDVERAGSYPTNATIMKAVDFANIARHGFETADATLFAYRPSDFPRSIGWSEIVGRLPSSSAIRWGTT